jgi:hypothetical protein
MAYMNPDGSYSSQIGQVPVLVLAPTTGSTVIVGASSRRLYVNTALLAALTVQLPRNPEHGQEFTLNTKTGVTAVTWKDGNGTTLAGLAGAAVANVPLTVVALQLVLGGAVTWTRWN